MRGMLFKPATPEQIRQREVVWKEYESSDVYQRARQRSERLLSSWSPYIEYVEKYMADHGHPITDEIRQIVVNQWGV